MRKLHGVLRRAHPLARDLREAPDEVGLDGTDVLGDNVELRRLLAPLLPSLCGKRDKVDVRLAPLLLPRRHELDAMLHRSARTVFAPAQAPLAAFREGRDEIRRKGEADLAAVALQSSAYTGSAAAKLDSGFPKFGDAEGVQLAERMNKSL